MSDDKESPPPLPDTVTFDAPALTGPADMPERIGRFLPRARLGGGAFGVVYRAFDPTLERDVAVKVPRFSPDQLHLMERFQREAKAIARLRHPSIVPVYECAVEGEQPYIVMELVEGGPLSDRLAERPDFRRAAEWVRDLALALQHAHSQGVLHRDIKPANILIDAQSRVRLTDFGLARLALEAAAQQSGDAADPGATRQGTVLGTPAYMAPEQARGDTAGVGPHTDQYGLGAVLYELLTGRVPFAGSVDEILALAADPHASATPPRQCDPLIPPSLEAIVVKATEKDSSRRYGSTAEMAADLQCWLNGAAVAAPLIHQAKLVRVCTSCQRPNDLLRRHCRYCGTGLRGVEPKDLAGRHSVPRSGPSERPVELRPLPTDMALVRAGLGLHVARMVAYLAALLAVAVLTVVGLPVGEREAAPPNWLTAMIAWATGGFLLVQTVLGLAGSALCLAAPRPSGARSLAAKSLALDLGAVAAGVILSFPPLHALLTLLFLPSVFPELASGALAVAAWGMFMGFVYRLASYLDDGESAADALRILRWGLALLAVPPVLLAAIACAVIAFEVGPAWANLAVGAALLVLLVWAVLLIKLFFNYLGLIAGLREDIAMWRPPSDEDDPQN